jgi:hypothetical protein
MITGSGNIITEKRSVNHFDGVKLSGSMDMEIKEGDVPSVEVEADDNVLPYIVTNVSGGMFSVSYRPNTSFNNAHTKVYVTVPSLKKVSISGSGNITSGDTIKSGDVMEFTINGSGDIKMLADAPSVKARVGGSGNMILAGRTKNFDGSSSGSGDLKCHNLLAENVTVVMSGSGNAHVFSSVSLKAKTRGSGDIYYSGKPAAKQQDKSGSGEIREE